MDFSLLQNLLDLPEEIEKALNTPAKVYVHNAKANTPADVKECPDSYIFIIDMPGLKPGDIKLEVEDNSVLVISGKRKREDAKDGKYVREERRVGKLMRKFSLPEDADTDGISAGCKDGVLTVTMKKTPPPEPKKPKKIEVQVA